jgi:hypothetical protein
MKETSKQKKMLNTLLFKVTVTNSQGAVTVKRQAVTKWQAIDKVRAELSARKIKINSITATKA